MKLLTSDQSKRIDAKAVELGVPVLRLMENAAIQLVKVIQRKAPEGKIVLFCGRGNNGGDALAATRLLRKAGRDTVTVVLAPGDTVLSEAAQWNARKLLEKRIDVQYIATDEELEAAFALCENASLFVDALFGTGLTRPPEGLFARTIRYMNESSVPVLSVDVPSGIDADDGSIQGEAVRADTTVALHAPKIGQILYPARSCCGTLQVVDIGISDDMNPIDACEMLTPADVRTLIPARNDNAHKGTCGHVLLMAGSRGMAGAGELAANGCMRSGAGKTTLACPQSLLNTYMYKLTEVLLQPLPDDGQGTLGRQALSSLSKLLEGKDVLAVGPGWGRSMDLPAILQALLAQIKIPCVIDADGLTALARVPDYRRALPTDTVLTPHPGEMSRLTGISVGEIVRDPIRHCRDFARRAECVVVLKGGCTVIADKFGRTTLNMTGNSGMATAGSGDVLTGVIAALIAQGLSPYNAARTGVWIHGRAGDFAVRTKGRMGLIASDLIESLPKVWLELDR